MSSSRTTRVSVEDLQKDAQAFSAWHDELDQSFETDPSSISDAIARCFEILVTTRQSFGDSARDASIAKTAETIFTQIDSVLKSFQTGDTLSQLNEDEGNKLKAVKKTYRQVKRDYEVLKARRTGKALGEKSPTSHRKEPSGHGWTLTAMAEVMKPTRSRQNSQSSPPSSPVQSRQPESPESPGKSRRSGLTKRSDGQIVQIRRKA